ncbi:hypothetical protein PACTADRAFT_50743 [Pachysolen tannophilus NRRL Y-2460]|uniref:Altered inheritance of mitochondria protein 19 homolog n=1 Tax=Pachysolen tannophilus NRRL Y-2460 TaxID=669874 RepID=A0A1E4TT13_PACTA|nr:hypothetical protein PACTADRAFT_50743 [Pachysolen tannophilus NRRL Y-2460]
MSVGIGGSDNSGSAVDQSKQEVVSIYDQINSLATTPYPAAFFASSLFITPMVKDQRIPAPVATSLTSSLTSRFIRPTSSALPTTISSNPTLLSCLLFGGFFGLGSFMINDNDLINGSGVISAWSALFCMVNFKRCIRSYKLWPKFLVSQALFNGFIYGRNFILGANL